MHIAISKKRHMANPKIHTHSYFYYNPSIFPYPPIYTKKFRTSPIKAVFSPIYEWGGGEGGSDYEMTLHLFMLHSAPGNDASKLKIRV